MSDPRHRFLPTEIDVFVAHASGDKPAARQLVTGLQALGLVPFIDEDLLPGDDWTLLLPEALRRSRLISVMVSARYNGAHYLRDEVVTAIRMMRKSGGEVRVVPLLLGAPDDLEAADPYGLATLNHLLWSDHGPAGVAARLAQVVARMKGSPPPPSAPTPTASAPAASPKTTPGPTFAKLDAALRGLVGVEVEQVASFLGRHDSVYGRGTTTAEARLSLANWGAASAEQAARLKDAITKARG